MKRLLHTLLLTSIFFYACNSPAGKQPASDRLVPEPDMMDRLKYQKLSIDSMYYRNQGRLTVYNKMANKDELVEMHADSIPEEDIETTYNILKDTSGQIVLASEIPFSQSGDWNISATHYFDRNGKTFAFERQTSFFNSGCTEGPAFETSTTFYNNAFEVVTKEYKLTDEKNKPLPKDSCVFFYKYEPIIVPDAAVYLKEIKVKIAAAQ